MTSQPTAWVPRWRNGRPSEEPRYLEAETDAWPDPYGPDPVVFGAVPRVRERWTWS
jgi:hypothetical protein